MSKTGTSTPPYTSWETASDSIQKAINICNDGDTIYVANGIYKETLLIETAVFLFGSSMDSTIIDGTDLIGKETSFPGVTIFVRESISIENFNLIGKSASPNTQVILSDSFPLSLQNCRIRNAYGGVGVSFNTVNLNNIILSNTKSDIYINPYLTPGDSYIRNCIIIKNSAFTDIAIDDWRGNTIIENNLIIASKKNILYGISLSLPNTKLIKNNTILNFYRSNISMDNNLTDSVKLLNNNIGYSENSGIWQPDGNNRLQINNNIIFKNRNSVAGNDSNKHRTDYNLFWKNTNDQTANLIMGENDIVADPMFVKDTIPSYPINFDFHLQKYSPAIDSGDPTILDVDGSRSDIGAYGGPGGQAYQYIDLPPTPPKNFQTSIMPDSNIISIKWDFNSESDFNYYKVYKDTISSFIPDSLTFYSFADTSIFTDYFTNANNVYYKITSIDYQGNESIPGETIAANVVGVYEPEAEIIRNYSLYQNYPNPFNPETKIIYTLKQKGYVKLMVYTILGEIIKVLVNEEKDEGLHEAILRFDTGFSSGIYLYRIEIIGENNIPKFSDMKKMIFMK